MLFLTFPPHHENDPEAHDGNQREKQIEEIQYSRQNGGCQGRILEGGTGYDRPIPEIVRACEIDCAYRQAEVASFPGRVARGR